MATTEQNLTIEGLDAQTFSRLEAEANRRGVTMSMVAGDILRHSVDRSAGVYHDLDPLVGTWSAEDAAAFEANTKSIRGFDSELWR